MKKKITSKINLSKATTEEKASARLIDSMVKIAKEPDPDEETFRLLVRTSNAKVLDALRSNKALNRSQKSELGIVEEPVFLSKDFRKLPAVEAKKELLKFFKEHDYDDYDDYELERFFALPSNARRTDLDLSTEECLALVREMRNVVSDSCNYSDLTFTNILSWLGEKKCEVRLNTDLISGLINDSSEFVVLLDKLSKSQQMDVIDLVCKSPLSAYKYIEILALCLGDPYLLEANIGGSYLGIDDEVMCDRIGISEWATYFLKTAKLSTADAKKLRIAMNNVDSDSMRETVLPLEVIDAALEAGITYVRHCSNFEKWLENLFAIRKKEKAATTKGSMPEQIAQWICEEDTNANKVCEVVELAASAKV